MTLLGLLSQPVTLTNVTAGSKGTYGNPTQTPTTVETTGRLYPRGGNSEVAEGLAVSEFILDLPPDVTPTHRSKATVSGADYEVVGEPYLAYRGSVPHHWMVPVKRVDA